MLKLIERVCSKIDLFVLFYSKSIIDLYGALKHALIRSWSLSMMSVLLSRNPNWNNMLRNLMFVFQNASVVYKLFDMILEPNYQISELFRLKANGNSML